MKMWRYTYLLDGFFKFENTLTKKRNSGKGCNIRKTNVMNWKRSICFSKCYAANLWNLTSKKL